MFLLVFFRLLNIYLRYFLIGNKFNDLAFGVVITVPSVLAFTDYIRLTLELQKSYCRVSIGDTEPNQA